jgi:hypothetical protein
LTEKHKIAAVIGVGAVAVLIYLMTRKATASNGSAIVDEAVAAPASYPNSNPIQMGDVNVGGSPLNLTYNTLEGGELPSTTYAVGSNTKAACGCDDKCEAAGQKVAQQKISPSAYQAALENFSAWAGHAGTA